MTNLHLLKKIRAFVDDLIKEATPKPRTPEESKAAWLKAVTEGGVVKEQVAPDQMGDMVQIPKGV